MSTRQVGEKGVVGGLSLPFFLLKMQGRSPGMFGDLKNSLFPSPPSPYIVEPTERVILQALWNKRNRAGFHQSFSRKLWKEEEGGPFKINDWGWLVPRENDRGREGSRANLAKGCRCGCWWMKLSPLGDGGHWDSTAESPLGTGGYPSMLVYWIQLDLRPLRLGTLKFLWIGLV